MAVQDPSSRPPSINQEIDSSEPPIDVSLGKDDQVQMRIGDAARSNLSRSEGARRSTSTFKAVVHDVKDSFRSLAAYLTGGLSPSSKETYIDYLCARERMEFAASERGKDPQDINERRFQFAEETLKVREKEVKNDRKLQRALSNPAETEKLNDESFKECYKRLEKFDKIKAHLQEKAVVRYAAVIEAKNSNDPRIQAYESELSKDVYYNKCMQSKDPAALEKLEEDATRLSNESLKAAKNTCEQLITLEDQLKLAEKSLAFWKVKAEEKRGSVFEKVYEIRVDASSRKVNELTEKVAAAKKEMRMRPFESTIYATLRSVRLNENETSLLENQQQQQKQFETLEKLEKRALQNFKDYYIAATNYDPLSFMRRQGDYILEPKRIARAEANELGKKETSPFYSVYEAMANKAEAQFNDAARRLNEDPLLKMVSRESEFDGESFLIIDPATKERLLYAVQNELGPHIITHEMLLENEQKAIAKYERLHKALDNVAYLQALDTSMTSEQFQNDHREKLIKAGQQLEAAYAEYEADPLLSEMNEDGDRKIYGLIEEDLKSYYKDLNAQRKEALNLEKESFRTEIANSQAFKAANQRLNRTVNQLKDRRAHLEVEDYLTPDLMAQLRPEQITQMNEALRSHLENSEPPYTIKLEEFLPGGLKAIVPDEEQRARIEEEKRFKASLIQQIAARPELKHVEATAPMQEPAIAETDPILDGLDELDDLAEKAEIERLYYSESNALLNEMLFEPTTSKKLNDLNPVEALEEKRLREQEIDELFKDAEKPLDEPMNDK